MYESLKVLQCIYNFAYINELRNQEGVSSVPCTSKDVATINITTPVVPKLAQPPPLFSKNADRRYPGLLNSMVGDWNFVREVECRFSVQREGWIGAQDTAERDNMEDALLAPFGLH